MCSEEVSLTRAEWTPSSKMVAQVMMIFALLGPIFIYVNSSPTTDLWLEIDALFWKAAAMDGPLIFIIGDLQIMLGMAMLLPLRLVFVRQMYRCYEGRTSKRATATVGLLSEIQVLVPFLFMLTGPSTPYLSLVAPVPLLFLAGLLLLITVPPPKDVQTWINKTVSLPRSQ